METRVCRRCLLAEDRNSKPLYELIREVIDGIPPEARAPESLYQSRLSACKGCNRLSGGMCALCGCYVEVRACKREQACPELPPKW